MNESEDDNDKLDVSDIQVKRDGQIINFGQNQSFQTTTHAQSSSQQNGLLNQNAIQPRMLQFGTSELMIPDTNIDNNELVGGMGTDLTSRSHSTLIQPPQSQMNLQSHNPFTGGVNRNNQIVQPQTEQDRQLQQQRAPELHSLSSFIHQ